MIKVILISMSVCETLISSVKFCCIYVKLLEFRKIDQIKYDVRHIEASFKSYRHKRKLRVRLQLI